MAWTTPKTDFVSGNILTAAQMNAIGNNLLALYGPVQRLGFQTRTTSHASSSTTFAGASNLFTSDISFTADGSSAYRVILWAPTLDMGAAGRDSFVALNLSGTETGRMNNFDVSSRSGFPFYLERWITPAAGSKTINFRHYHAGGATTLVAGDGTGTNAPTMWMALYGPALA